VKKPAKNLKKNAEARKQRDNLTRATGAKKGKKTNATQWNRWTP